MLDYRALKELDLGSIRQTYTERDTMVYALSVGLGMDPLDRRQLRYVYEQDLLAMPTMAGVLAWPQFWARQPQLGLTYAKIVHAEQDLRVFKALPVSGSIIGRSRIGTITDRGTDKGAVVTFLRDIIDATDNTTLASVSQTLIMRGDGGYSQQGAPSDPPPPGLSPLPQRPCDVEVDLTVPLNAALLYRHCGDLNPLHVDPDQASRGGFDRPPLQGLCTYGMAAHALLRCVCNYDAKRLQRLAVKFSAPVFPGDTIRFQLWREDARTVRISGIVRERDSKVIDRGLAEIADPAHAQGTAGSYS